MRNQLIFKSRRIFSLLVFSLFTLSSFKAQNLYETASVQASNQLLKSMLDTNELVYLIVVEKTYHSDMKRIQTLINEREKASNHYSYLQKQKKNVELEKSRQDQFNAEFREATKGMLKIDQVFFLPDTAWNSCIDNKVCTTQNHNGDSYPTDLESGTFFFLVPTNHPSTRKRGYYFFTEDKKYLDNPFIDYLPSHSTFEMLFSLRFNNNNRTNPYTIVKKFNGKLLRKLGYLNQFYQQQNQ